MIETIETRLHSAMNDRTMVDAMLRALEGFQRYRDVLPFVPAGYTRTLLQKTADFEMVAMLWAPQSVSAIHDHGDSRCWVLMIAGALDVDNYDRLDDREARADIVHSGSIVVERGELDHRLNWRELHRVRNARPESAYMLQIYSPLLRTYCVVNEHTRMTLSVQALYDSIYDL